MKDLPTFYGPIRKVGTWTLSLTVERANGGTSGARLLAYAIAVRVSEEPDMTGRDIRVVESQGLHVTIEVETPEEFAPFAEALARAAEAVRVRRKFG